MSRLKPCLVSAMLLAPVLLIWGKLVFTEVKTWRQVETKNDLGLIIGRNVGYAEVCQHGWPWVYLQTVDSDGLTLARPAEHEPFSLGALIGDLLLATSTISVCVALLVRHQRRRGAWLRFSIREVIVATAVVAVACGWCLSNYRKWQTEEQIAGLFGYMVRGYGNPNWLQRLWPTEQPNVFQPSRRFTLHLQTSRPRPWVK